MNLQQIKDLKPKAVNFKIKRQSDQLEKIVNEYKESVVIMEDMTVFSLNDLSEWDIIYPPNPYPNGENL